MGSIRFILYLLPLLVIISNVRAQQHDLKLSRTKIEFGETEQWLSRIDTIVLTNDGNQPVSILKRKPPAHTQIEWPEGKIPPGSQRMIRLVYAPKTKGPFHVEIPVYYSTSPKPVTIELTGQVVSFAENAFTACPTLGKKKTEVRFLHRGIVVDSLTGKPIQGAIVEIRDVKEDQETNAKGVYEKQMPIGRYRIKVNAEHYGSKDTTAYLNRNNPFLRFELPRTGGATVTYGGESSQQELPQEHFPGQPSDEAKPGRPPVPPGLPDTTQHEPDQPTQTPTAANPKDTVLLPVEEFKPNNVVFLIDVSSSMDAKDKLPYLKLSINNMVRHLRAIDRISVVRYATVSHTVLPTTPANNKDEIYQEVHALEARGSTKATRGLKKAYQAARQAFVKDGNNQVIIATDGKFDALSGSGMKLNMMVRWNAFRGIQLSVVGFGHDREAIDFMKRMAQKGNGNFLHIEEKQQAQKALLQEIKKNSRRSDATASE